MQLRDYQIDGIERIRDAFRRGVMRPLYVLPTGGGKTVMFTHMARAAAQREKRVAILVHRRELLLQTCTALGTRHGIVAPGHRYTDEWIQVASVPTLARRLGQYRFDFLIIDEAHHATASTWMKIIEANSGAHVLGVTATPCRLAGRGLSDLFEQLIVGPSPGELTDRGYLVPVEAYAPGTVDTSGVHVSRGDYVKREIEERVDKPTITGCAVDHYRRLADGLPTIAFCVGVQHAEHVAERFRAAGYRAKRVDGGTPQRERDAAIQDLGQGRLHMLTSCELISEGVDVPVVTVGILLRPTQSATLARQQIGRILRPSPGKDRAIILDHVGNYVKHELYLSDPEWSLKDGQVSGNSGGNGIQVRQCMQCYYVHGPAPRCPACGYEYPVNEIKPPEEVEGELQRIEELVAARQRRRAVGQARDRESLEQIAAARGYKRGWVEHILRARAQHVAAER